MKKISVYILFIFLTKISFAQNTASPYSTIGFGDIEKGYFDRTSALGYNGVAMVSDRFVLISNPASISFLMPSGYQNPFYVDVAARFKSTIYSGTPIKTTTDNNASDLQFKKLTFTTKLNNKWGLSFGVLPFASSSYSFTSPKEIIGSSTTVNAQYVGTGSTNLVYVSNSYAIGKKLSVGVQTSILFGNTDRKEYVYSAITDSLLETDEQIFLSKVMFKGGVIYKDTINKNWNYSLGATGSLKTKINANQSVTVKDGSQVLKNTNKQILDYTALPAMFTIGLAVNYKNIFTVVADYTHQDWNSINQRAYNYSITNYGRFGMGFQFTQLNKDASKKRGENYYQIGFYSTNGYLNINNQNIKESAVTFGIGKQFYDPRLSLQFNAELGTRGTTANNLIKENFTQIGLTVSFRDFWNTKKIKRYN